MSEAADRLADEAIALLRAGRHREAAQRMHRSLELSPLQPDRVVILAHSMVELGALDLAGQLLTDAIAIAPEHWAAHNNLGVVREREGRDRDALAAFERSIALRPRGEEARFNRGRVLLRLGRYDPGWAEYAWREQLADATRPPDPSVPRWDGTPAPDRTLLVYSEQGLGDTVQFARYVPAARERVGRVVLAVQPPLVPLLTPLHGVDVLARPALDTGVHYDLRLPLLALPGLFTPDEESIPPPVALTASRPDRLAHWAARLAPEALNVGVAFTVNRDSPSHRDRVVDPAMLAVLARLPGVALHCLHHEFREPVPGLPGARTHGASIRPFEELAALIRSLDLVVTVDTVIAHLAATLGRPTWTLIPYAGDWRWQVGRPDTPWYPTMRLYRQPAPDAWGPAIESVASDLATRSAARR